MDALDLHARLATAALLYLTVLGAWGLLIGLRGTGPTPAYRGGLVIGEIAVLAQGALGLAAWPSRGPAPWIHVLYGLALVLAIPLAATMVRQGSPRRTSLALGVASLFAAGLAVRGMTTG